MESCPRRAKLSVLRQEEVGMNEYAIAFAVGAVIILVVMIVTGVLRTIVWGIVSLFTGGDVAVVPRRAGKRRRRR